MQRVDLDPEDLRGRFPEVVITAGEGREVRDFAGIREDLETRGCAFIRGVVDGKIVHQARGVVMSHLLACGLVSTEAGDCPSGQGTLLTGFREVTHSREML